jgi:site-specific recombinase XerD
MGRPPSQPFASDLTGEAFDLFEQVQGRHDRHHLRGFLGYLCHRGIHPSAANDSHLQAYLKELERLKVDRVTQVGRDVAITWNRMGGVCRSWPTIRLVVVDSLGPRSLPFSAFPASFEKEVHAYLEREPLKEDLFDEVAYRSFAPATRIDRAHKIRQLATVAVGAGVAPSSIRGLRDLLEVAKITLSEVWHQHDRKPNGHAANLARTLLSIAKYLGIDRSRTEELKRAHKTMRPKKSGMTERNLSRLRALTDKATLRRLVQLPNVVLASMDKHRPTIRDALLLQSALGVAIQFSAPMRAKNLAGLHNGQIDDKHIVIPREQVKNDRTLHYRLPVRVTTILDTYQQCYLPLLQHGKSGDHLFISMTGKQKRPSELSTQLTKFIQDQTGLIMNVHLFRHLAGYIFLKEHGEYEPVRQLLGHKSLNTTIAFYTGLEVEANLARYDAILDRLAEPQANHATP